LLQFQVGRRTQSGQSAWTSVERYSIFRVWRRMLLPLGDE
jgi:hypothetical protein